MSGMQAFDTQDIVVPASPGCENPAELRQRSILRANGISRAQREELERNLGWQERIYRLGLAWLRSSSIPSVDHFTTSNPSETDIGWFSGILSHVSRACLIGVSP